MTRDSERVSDILVHVLVAFCKMKTVRLGSIGQECKYANRYFTQGTNTNVEEERMHVAWFRGRGDDEGWKVCRRGKNNFKREQKEKVYEGVQGTAQRHIV